MWRVFRIFYYQNKTKIWKYIFIVAFLIVLVQVLNLYAKNKSEKLLNENTTSNIEENTLNETIQNVISSDKSSLTGETLSENKLSRDVEVINKFLEYCNQRKTSEAYQMLTENCKKVMYSNEEEFNKNYCLQNFTGGNVWSVQNWIGDIYKVRITEDILSTGNYNSGIAIEDYITVDTENGEKKLNINRYIGKSSINVTREFEDIEITIVSKNTYMNYEEYEIKVTNNTSKTILLDPLEKVNTMYLKDTNNMQYNSYNHEIIKNRLIVNPKMSKTINIKFMNDFSSTREIQSITFSNIILDYIEYENTQNKEEYTKIFEARIGI